MKMLALALLASLSLAGCQGNSQSYSWKPNRFTEMLDKGEDFTKVTGFKRSADWKKNAVFDDIKVNTATLPKHWDWREFAPFREPRNQGSCGSCWGFSVDGVTEIVWQLLHPEFYPQLLLAPQALVSCSRYDCGGGNFDAFDYIQSKGLPVEADYPYTARNGSCKTFTPFMKITRWAYVGSGGEPTVEQIKQAIYDHGPVSVDVAANNSWSGYSGGIYDSCNSSSVNHMVILTGWDDTDGKGYWYLLNSWGDWGEKGYMKTRYTKSGSNTKCNEVGETTAYAIVDGVENLREYLGLPSGN